MFRNFFYPVFTVPTFSYMTQSKKLKSKPSSLSILHHCPAAQGMEQRSKHSPNASYMRELYSCSWSCSFHEGQESRKNWHMRAEQREAQGNHAHKSQEWVGEPQRKPRKFTPAHGQVTSSSTWEGGGHQGCSFLRPQDVVSLSLSPFLGDRVCSLVWVPQF